jgi:hypothetical protein
LLKLSTICDIHRPTSSPYGAAFFQCGQRICYARTPNAQHHGKQIVCQWDQVVIKPIACQ